MTLFLEVRCSALYFSIHCSVFGMTGHVPDFGMLMVGANAGIVGMTKEHLGLALALRYGRHLNPFLFSVISVVNQSILVHNPHKA